MNSKGIAYAILIVVGLVSYNVWLAQRDQKMFKAYDACTHFTHHPDCPYTK
jgi:hypothetical protein